ncbi:hypothetical protein HDA44_001864 [Kribbella solani]|uniref:Uncharacterized protein n=1 Tax=Kribbella solani TaxID=236067 RepID=A0A841DIX8_9ACTN|nr:hypothetical protein [Kribbella solani]
MCVYNRSAKTNCFPSRCLVVQAASAAGHRQSYVPSEAAVRRTRLVTSPMLQLLAGQLTRWE